MFTQKVTVSAAETIGTVTQVYDGTLASDIQVNTFRKWDETYTDPASDRRRMLEAQIAQQPGAIMDLMAKLPRAGAPGTIWNYWPFSARFGSTNQGAFQALGIYGQHIYVNPREHVVIVVWSALPKPTGMEVIADEDFFAGCHGGGSLGHAQRARPAPCIDSPHAISYDPPHALEATSAGDISRHFARDDRG